MFTLWSRWTWRQSYTKRTFSAWNVARKIEDKLQGVQASFGYYFNAQKSSTLKSLKSVFLTKKNRQKSEVFVCFIDERHLYNFYISLKLFVYFFSCLFTLSAVVYFSVSCLFTFLAAVYFFSSQLADCRLFVYFFSWLFTIFDSCLFTIWIFPPKLSYFSFVLNFLGHPVLQEV